MRSHSFLSVCVIFGVFALVAQGAAIPWVNGSGTNAAFSWSNGDSGEALWGDPAVSVNGFVFDDMDEGFVAGPVTNPMSDSIVSSMHVLLDMSGRAPIQTLRVYESGSYTGDPADVAGSWGGVVLTFLDPMPVQGPVVMPGNLNFSFNDDGTWEAELEISLDNLDPALVNGATLFNLEVTNHLHAAPVATVGQASITKEYARIDVPEPATLVIVLAGGLLVVPGRVKRTIS